MSWLVGMFRTMSDVAHSCLEGYAVRDIIVLLGEEHDVFLRRVTNV